MHPVSAIQMEWSLDSRDIEPEVVPTARELGVAIVAYSPLGRGLLTQAIAKRYDGEHCAEISQPPPPPACSFSLPRLTPPLPHLDALFYAVMLFHQ